MAEMSLADTVTIWNQGVSLMNFSGSSTEISRYEKVVSNRCDTKLGPFSERSLMAAVDLPLSADPSNTTRHFVAFLYV